MTFLISTLSILAAVGLLAYMFRDKLENFAPGWKLHVTNAVVAVGGIVAAVTASLSGLTAADLAAWGMDFNKATSLIAAIGVINMILSFVTKRPAPPVAG